MGAAIEGARIPVSEQTIFSYRFVREVPDGHMFDDTVNWRAFVDRSAFHAANHDFVIVCDISDFYSRIYHHRVENALKWLKTKPDVAKRIVALLKVFAGTVSYGLPVGGPASRLLAELALNSVDKLMRAEGIHFCRFTDDYRIFCDTREEAYQRLIFISEKLFNEGLSLQKNKTRILTSKEFLNELKLLIVADQRDEESLTDEEKLLRISVRFDPYSATRVDDYERLKEQVAKIDIAGILGRELEKTRIDPAITKQAISALRVVEPATRKDILASLLQIENLNLLAPVFPRLMTVLRGLYADVDPETQEVIDKALMQLVVTGSHLVKVDLNLAYVLQVLRRDSTQLKRSSLYQGV